MDPIRARVGWIGAIAVLALATACGGSSSRDADDTGPGPTPTEASSPSAAPPPGGSLTACELVTVEDAGATLGSDVSTVGDPVVEGLVSSVSEAGTACAYRPMPEDDGRSVTVLTFSDGAVDVDALVATGLSLGGAGFERWEVDGTIVVRKSDVVVTITVVSDPDEAPDRAAGLELSDLAAARMADPAPDPDNLACTLLDEAVAEAALGVPLRYAGGEVLDATTSGCGYVAEDRPLDVALRVTTGAEARAQFDSARADAEADASFDAVTDIGDDAFLTSGTSDVNVVVLVRERVFRLTTFASDGALIEPTIALAQQIAAIA